MTTIQKNTLSGLLVLLTSFCFVACGTNDDNTTGSTPIVIVDTDSDGVADNADNCVNVANADQADIDNDGLGDACDPVNNNIPAPEAPSALTASISFGVCDINVQFTDNADNEDSFVLVRTADISGSTVSSTLNIPASAGTGAVNYTDTSVNSSMSNISYSVRARNASGDSAEVQSNITIATPGC